MKPVFRPKSLLYSFTGIILGSIVGSIALFTIHRPFSQAFAPIAPSRTTPATQPSLPLSLVEVDQHFIIMMIPHHQDAIDMAELALTRSQRPEIQTLAKAIQQTQSQEIQQMQDWYKQWYGTDVPDWTPGMGMGMGMGRGGMGMGNGMMATDLIALETATDFDREFLQQMIPHHQMAVRMATMVLNRGSHPELQELAQTIIKDQSREIEQMQQWYDAWYTQEQKP